MANCSHALPSGCTRKWYYFVTASVAPYFGFLIVFLVYRLVLVLRKADDSDAPRSKLALLRLKLFKDWVSLNAIGGRILAAFAMLFSMGSFIIYIRDTFPKRGVECLNVERCDVYSDPWFIVDAAFNAYFLLYFLLRFLAAKDKLVFWVTSSTIADFATIPPIIYALGANQWWLGLRFWRIGHLLSLPILLESFGVVKSRKLLLALNPFLSLLVVWLLGASIVHLLENTGDPWVDFTNAMPVDYFTAQYFIAVTMSTVGYGDLSAETTLGRIFMIIFIVGGLALFASYVPLIVDYIGDRNKYLGSYDPITLRHLVVCGDVTAASMENFLKDFFHEDRDEEGKTTVVFLDLELPSAHLKSILRYYALGAEYFQGSPLSIKDLKRVKLKDAEACIILADNTVSNREEKDSENMMRAVSIKNYKQDMRIVMQVLLQKNKALVQSIPNFDPRLYGDAIICVTELKLSMIAQSCLCPGFSTLLCNIIGIGSYEYSNVNQSENWQDSYFFGCGYEFYMAQLSENFVLMTFPEVAEICFKKWNIVLLAVEDRSSSTSAILLNPSRKEFVVSKGTQGYFLAFDKETAEKASYFSESYSVENDEIQLKSFSRKSQRFVRRVAASSNDAYEEDDGDQLDVVDDDEKEEKEEEEEEEEKLTPASVGIRLNRSASFYVCDQAQSFEEALLTDGECEYLRHHIVVCVIGDDSSVLIGLKDMLLPMRASNLAVSELKLVVLLGDRSYLEREWESLSSLNDIRIICGSPLVQRDLRRAMVNTSSMCVFLRSSQCEIVGQSKDEYLIDKECILGTLNLKSMKFSSGKGAKQGYDIPIITDLAYDSNVQFLDQEDEDNPDAALCESQPFAFGQAISSSIMDSVVSSVYCDRKAMTLLHLLLNTEEIVTEDDDEGEDDLDVKSKIIRCRLTQCPIIDPPFDTFADGGLYGDMFTFVLRSRSFLCLGLYRAFGTQRCVITSPPYDYPLRPSDRVFVIKKGK